jgi:GrpB-like predicted nucleotidyltransferase (UPF0157 family)
MLIDGVIRILDYDPEWPRRFERESTSVPDLPAKPIIDILLVVADSAQEDACAPFLEQSG